MENANRALMMAASVFIAILLISALVLFFNNLSELQAQKERIKETDQAVEFNKQFDSYERNVYGSDLLSIANKVADYNKTESEDNGYQKVELIIHVNKDINSEFFKKGDYNSTTIISEINKIEKKEKELAGKSVKFTKKRNRFNYF